LWELVKATVLSPISVTGNQREREREREGERGRETVRKLVGRLGFVDRLEFPRKIREKGVESPCLGKTPKWKDLTGKAMRGAQTEREGAACGHRLLGRLWEFCGPCEGHALSLGKCKRQARLLSRKVA
jgi:hypothetical protein